MTVRIFRFVPVATAVLFLIAAPELAAQASAPRPEVTAEDYARAEKYLGGNASLLVFKASVQPNWISGDRFWYRNRLARGAEFILVDPARGSRGPAFDQAGVAAALSAVEGKSFDAADLPFTDFEYAPDGKGMTFVVGSRRYSCDLKGRGLKAENIPPETAAPRRLAEPETVSPDGRLAVFIRNDNLWLRDRTSGAETQLTFDGVKDYGYATDNAGWRRSDRPVATWSPDGRKIATFQQDQRGVGEMYLVETRVGHPVLQAWKYPLPGDEKVTMIERVVVHLDGPRVVRLKMPPDQHRGSTSDDIRADDGSLDDVAWSPDSRRLAFVSSSRDHKTARLREADPETGEVREVYQETAPTYFESGADGPCWRYLPGSGEFIWFSEKEDRGRLYLHDLGTGRLKNPITSGPGRVAGVVRVEAKDRRLIFVGLGMEPGRDPYFRHLYSVDFDGRNQVLLTPEDMTHDAVLSPSGKWFIDTFSRPEVPSTTVLRTAAGRLVLTLEQADISALLETGWTPPTPFMVKGRDGKTDLYGLMFRPTNFDSNKKYPIINNIYPGPQSGSVGSRSFSASRRWDARAVAELGFVVVQIDGMGTPNRSKSFHDAYYGDMADNTLPDQVAGMKELAARYPWIDIARAGIYGHSGGGFASCAAMFHYPDFFKVGVSQAGNHDNQGYEDDWGEKWHGLLVRNPDGTSNYDSQANQNFAKNLEGKLLIAHGSMDSNVPPYLTLLVVDALIAANKDFDMILFPNRGHGFGSEPYMTRRRWDYFVRHLLGAEPPKEFAFQPAAGSISRRGLS
ncbi:MAG: DPP IV N-terminal domain-containing protein [Candidatus Aminicenantes bacterium]|nr:DPP IV N-terminal domain-containing protein [Candidatus Aminicenantes bacterium]